MESAKYLRGLDCVGKKESSETKQISNLCEFIENI